MVERGQVAGTMPGDGSRLQAKLAIGPARQSLRQQVVVAPLQRVVGDDAAPQGPPSGTITTRFAAATSGEEGDLEAFAQGEEKVALGEKIEVAGDASDLDVLAGRATGAQIHNAQVDNGQAAEEAARQFIGGAPGAVPTAGGGDPIEGNYKSHTKPELEAEAARRGIDVEGKNKPEIVDALEADDDAQA